MLENILTLGQNVQAKVRFGLGLKFHSLGSNTWPKHIDFTSFLKFYGLGLFHIGPKDVGLTMFAKTFVKRMFIRL
jgi:hypothetical protein